MEPPNRHETHRDEDIEMVDAEELADQDTVDVLDELDAEFQEKCQIKKITDETVRH